MIDISHLPPRFQTADVKIFTGSSPVAGGDYQVWNKPVGKSMVDIFLIGKGGNGGTGVIGANSVAAGGGGGGSAGTTRLTMAAHLLPDILYISLPGPSTATTPGAYISIAPKLTSGAGAPTVNDILMVANAGGQGGNASAGTGGTAGSAATAANAGTMPLGWQFAAVVLGGIAGGVGGTTVTATNVALPVIGNMTCAGTGGGGLPAAGIVGTNGGALPLTGSFPLHQGGVGAATATVPPTNGTSGYRVKPKLNYFYSGTGGGSTHGTATGAGLVQASGGNGGFGSGGGGAGGALTGSTPGFAGLGGASMAIITCW